MNRYLIILILVSALGISFSAPVLQADEQANKGQRITQEQAAELAARLANERFRKGYGRTPFTPQSYTAELTDSRWRWGVINPIGINGCAAEVEFNEDGTDQKVRVALFDDTNHLSTDKPAIEKDVDVILEYLGDVTIDTDKDMHINIRGVEEAK
jgi:hypothetical protein